MVVAYNQPFPSLMDPFIAIAFTFAFIAKLSYP